VESRQAGQGVGGQGGEREGGGGKGELRVKRRQIRLNI